MIYVSYFCDDEEGSPAIGGSMMDMKKPKTWNEIENIKELICRKENVSNVVLINWTKM
jgi:hypothetical protein